MAGAANSKADMAIDNRIAEDLLIFTILFPPSYRIFINNSRAEACPREIGDDAVCGKRSVGSQGRGHGNGPFLDTCSDSV
jgi:hypothetical protein